MAGRQGDQKLKFSPEFAHGSCTRDSPKIVSLAGDFFVTGEYAVGRETRVLFADVSKNSARERAVSVNCAPVFGIRANLVKELALFVALAFDVIPEVLRDLEADTVGQEGKLHLGDLVHVEALGRTAAVAATASVERAGSYELETDCVEQSLEAV